MPYRTTALVRGMGGDIEREGYRHGPFFRWAVSPGLWNIVDLSTGHTVIRLADYRSALRAAARLRRELDGEKK